MKKILYIIQGTNLNLFNRSLEYIAKEQNQVHFCYFDYYKFNKNGTKNSFLPYIQSLTTYVNELKEKINIDLDYLKAKDITEIKKHLDKMLLIFDFDEIVLDTPIMEMYDINIPSYITKNIKITHIQNENYPEFTFGTAKKGAEVLMNSEKILPKIIFNNIKKFENDYLINKFIINKDFIVDKNKIFDNILFTINNNYKVNRDKTYGSMKISPYINTGLISIYELIQKYSHLQSNESAFHFFRELAFFIMATQKISRIYWNGYLDFKSLSISLLSNESLNNFKKHNSDKRLYNYTIEQLENGQTHSDLYNKTVEIVKRTGFLHNRIRMWWISWLIGNTRTFKEAYDFAIYFQNKYCSDSRHPVTYFCTIEAFKITPKKEEDVYGRILRMVEENAKEKIGVQYDDLFNKCINKEINYNGIYNYV